MRCPMTRGDVFVLGQSLFAGFPRTGNNGCYYRIHVCLPTCLTVSYNLMPENNWLIHNKMNIVNVM